VKSESAISNQQSAINNPPSAHQDGGATSLAVLAYNLSMEPISHIQKTYIKLKIAEQPSDFAFWQTQPYEMRLAALEEIRQEYHRWKYGAEPRLQRVFTIVKR
jgi:hypothetical protein